MDEQTSLDLYLMPEDDLENAIAFCRDLKIPDCMVGISGHGLKRFSLASMLVERELRRTDHIGGATGV